MTALAYMLQLLTALPQLVQAGVEITGLVTKARGALQSMSDENRGPTAQEWADLDAEIKRLRGDLHAGEDTTGTDG